MKMRLYQGLAPAKKSAGPSTPGGWSLLLGHVIARATELSDRRLAGLLSAQSEGRSEKLLRSMGILSDADILREFPDKIGR